MTSAVSYDIMRLLQKYYKIMTSCDKDRKREKDLNYEKIKYFIGPCIINSLFDGGLQQDKGTGIAA